MENFIDTKALFLINISKWNIILNNLAWVVIALVWKVLMMGIHNHCNTKKVIFYHDVTADSVSKSVWEPRL